MNRALLQIDPQVQLFYYLCMRANQAYFYRNRGPWNWAVEINILSWKGLWHADIPFVSKICVSALVAMQWLPGPIQMWTRVISEESQNVVRHFTKMQKWGVTIYGSEKNFHLSDDGFGLRLEGTEFFWPLSFLPFRFLPTTGFVDPSTSRATYQMPMAGTKCNCQAVLEYPRGHIDIETPWLRGRFTLTDESNKILESRFENPDSSSFSV